MSADPAKSVHSSRMQRDDDLDPPQPNRRVLTIPLPFQVTPVQEQRFLLDDTVATVAKVFGDVLVGGGWQWVGDDAAECKALTDQIQGARGFDQLMDGLAQTIFRRFTAAEIVWDTSQLWVPTQYKMLPDGRNGQTYIDMDEVQDVVQLRVTTSGGLQALPLQNAVIFRYRPTFADPMGQTVFTQVKEILQFKRATDEATVQYVQRISGGLVIFWYAAGLSEADQKQLLEEARKLRSSGIAVLPGPHDPENNSVQLLESNGESGGAGVLVDVAKQYQRRLAQVILGSILAIFDAEYGTRAQADTHLSMLKAIVARYQGELIEAPINQQILRPVLEYNVGRGKDVKLLLNPPNWDDLDKLGMLIENLTNGGYLSADSEVDKARVLKAVGMDD